MTISGGTLSTGGGSGNGMQVKGDWNITGGTFSSGTGAQCYVTFNGTTNQHIDATTFNWVYFYNNGGAIYLDGDMTIMTAANFWVCMVYGRYGATNAKLIFLDGADAAAEGATAFFEGAVKKVGNDSFQFPIGKNGVWAPLDIINPPNITDAFTAEYFTTGYASLTPLAPTIDHVSPDYYWQLDQNTGISSVNVKLYWKSGSTGVTNLATLSVARWNAVLWQDLGGVTSGNTSSGDCRTASAVPTTPLYGPFTLASTSAATNPLPVDLLFFDAVSKDEAVDISWQTASEKNCDYFSLEKSSDGTAFSEFANVKGAGNSSITKSYSFADTEPFSGVSYYRLRQVDFNG